MRKILSVLLILVILFGAMPSAFAAFSSIVESKPYYKSLSIDVAIEGIGDYEFYASVGNDSIIPISAKKIDADQIGHIIVVDLAWTWTTTINEQYVLVPAVQDYLSQLDSRNKVMFIFAGSGGPRVSPYMSVSEGYSYVEANLICINAAQGEIGRTAIDASLRTAFTEAIQHSDGDPLFKTVFALVDPANPGKGMTATDIRNSYVKEGNAFPVLVATINPVTYLQEGRYASEDVKEGIKYYTQFAQNNGSQLNVMDFVYVPRQTFRAGYNVSETIGNRSYYTLDLSPLHRYMDYSRSTNELSIYISNSRGSASKSAVYDVPVNALPTAAPTFTPTITPPPTPTPTPTPEPTPTAIVYKVKEGDKTPEAMQAIKRLQELYYLKVSDNDLPKEFNYKCKNAFADFCYNNGYEIENNITSRMFDYLMSDEAKPAPTPKLVTLAPTPTLASTPTLAPTPTLASTPTLAPTPTSMNTPDPVVQTTIPPEGFRPGQTDTEDSNFIARMQNILKNLNLYSAEMETGKLDQPTLDAIVLYCEEYGLHLDKGEYIPRSIILDILENGANRAPYEQPITEKLLELLHKEIMVLGDFHVVMWMLLIVIVVLLFVIVLIIILSRKTAKWNDYPIAPSYKLDEKDVPTNREMSQMGAGGMPGPTQNTFDADDDATVKLGSGINVTLNISGGLSSGVQRVLISSKPFIIGRPTKNKNEQGCDLALEGDGSVSRRHVQLEYKDKQLYIKNLSSNGTSVNGQNLSDQSVLPISDETAPLKPGSTANADGFALQRGDIIGISGYTIQIDW